MQKQEAERRIVQRLELLRSELGLWEAGAKGEWLPTAIGSWTTEDMIQLVTGTARYLNDIQRGQAIEDENRQGYTEAMMTQADIDLMGFYDID